VSSYIYLLFISFYSFLFIKIDKFKEMNKLVKTVYVSAAVNNTPNCLDWGLNGLVIYGSSNAIHLYDPQIMVTY